MAKAIGIDHIAIYFSDMEAAKSFFIKGFGLTLKEEYDDEIFIKAGNQILAIFKGENKRDVIFLNPLPLPRKKSHDREGDFFVFQRIK